MSFPSVELSLILQAFQGRKQLKLLELALALNLDLRATQACLEQFIQAALPLEKKDLYYRLKPDWQPLQAIILPQFFARMEVFDVIDSTNQYLKQQQFEGQRRVCVAEMQTQGRGRFGRKWQSPFGLNLYLSLRYHFPQPLTRLSGLSIVIGLAVCQALSEPRLKLKWPNDLWFQQKKLGGILIEIVETQPNYTECIIGLGLNINGQPATPETSPYAWTSLEAIRGEKQDRQMIMRAILIELHQALERFNQDGLTSFMSAWQERDALWQQELELIQGQKKFRGLGFGINQLGQLVIKDNEGRFNLYDGGEVTIKL